MKRLAKPHSTRRADGGRKAVLLKQPAAAVGSSVSVRQAKSQLSALLEAASAGREITITSDGKPKARLVPVSGEPKRKVFGGMGDFLRRQAIRNGPSADELIRNDRDGRGW